MPESKVAARLQRLVSDQPWRAEAADLGKVGAKAMSSGAGRAARISASLQLLPVADRQIVLSALEEATVAMSDREIEKALMVTDLSMRDRKRLVHALRPYRILMLVQR